MVAGAVGKGPADLEPRPVRQPQDVLAVGVGWISRAGSRLAMAEGEADGAYARGLFSRVTLATKW